MIDRLRDELCVLLNKYGAEAASDTPDFVLAQFLTGCLRTFDEAVAARSRWYAGGKPLVASPPSTTAPMAKWTCGCCNGTGSYGEGIACPACSGSAASGT